MNAGTDAQVAVVGAGPAGLIVAFELGLAGVRTVLLERSALPNPRSPGVALSNGAVELLEQRGLMQALRPRTAVLPASHFSILPLETAGLNAEHEDSVLVAQSEVEQALETRVAATGVTILRGCTVVDLDQDTDGVTVTFEHAGATDRLRCRYLVGCDGVESTVRELAGIKFPGTAPPFHGLYGDLPTDGRDLPPQQRGAHYSGSGGIHMCVPVIGAGVSRVITAEFGISPVTPDAPASTDDLRDAVRRLTGTELGAEPLWLSRFGNLTALADSYRSGRVFLAGDAAHTHLPLNGQALHTALYDGMNLGWKLASVLRGWTSDELLDTYEAERLPIGRRVCGNVRAQVELARGDEQIGALREVFSELIRLPDTNRYLVEFVAGLDVRYPMDFGDAAEPDEPHRLLGRRPPSIPLRTTVGESSTTRILHPGRGVLLDLSGRAEPIAELLPWRERVDLVQAEPTPLIDADAVLLRPDGHIAWLGHADGPRKGLTASLSAWFGTRPASDS